ncbi:MAG: hypothetical protein SGCHY_001747 [Lobulomycetales sp.]
MNLWKAHVALEQLDSSWPSFSAHSSHWPECAASRLQRVLGRLLTLQARGSLLIWSGIASLLVGISFFVLYAIWDTAFGAVTAATTSLTDNSANVPNSGYYFQDSDGDYISYVTAINGVEQSCTFYTSSSAADAVSNLVSSASDAGSLAFMAIGAVYGIFFLIYVITGGVLYKKKGPRPVYPQSK